MSDLVFIALLLAGFTLLWIGTALWKRRATEEPTPMRPSRRHF